jgi:hypothetical protein
MDMNNILFVMGEIPAPCTNSARRLLIPTRNKNKQDYETIARDNRVMIMG